MGSSKLPLLARLVLAGSVALGGCGSPIAVGATPDVPMPESTTLRGLVEDFEGPMGRWRNATSGTMEATITRVDEAKFGRHAAIFRFAGERPPGDWSDLYIPLADGWPADARAIVFWVRAEHAVTILAKVVEGRAHDEIEQFGAAVEVGLQWEQVRLPVSAFSRHIWSSQHKPGRTNGRLEPENIAGFGFAELDFPASVVVDHIYFAY